MSGSIPGVSVAELEYSPDALATEGPTTTNGATKVVAIVVAITAVLIRHTRTFRMRAPPRSERLKRERVFGKTSAEAKPWQDMPGLADKPTGTGAVVGVVARDGFVCLWEDLNVCH